MKVLILKLKIYTDSGVDLDASASKKLDIRICIIFLIYLFIKLKNIFKWKNQTHVDFTVVSLFVSLWWFWMESMWIWCFHLWICIGVKLGFILFFIFDLCCSIFICKFMVYFYLWIHGVVVCYSMCWIIFCWIIIGFYLIFLVNSLNFKL